MKLNRSNLNAVKSSAPSDLTVGVCESLPERVLQFGEGNFLRGFADYMIDVCNSNGLFNGGVVVVQPIEKGLSDTINEQGGLYTLILRGIENNNTVCEKRLITSINRAINPYSDYDAFIECAKNPDLRFIISNTTEAGISYDPDDKLSDRSQKSFPGKLTAFLYERFQLFSGDSKRGFIILPCELIDNNGAVLKQIVARYADEWQLGEDFTEWLTDANVFTSTLVDRIVTGYPKDEARGLEDELGYTDALLDTAEIFHTWVIESERDISSELPFTDIGLKVIFTDDVTPYKTRKVRILNGAHTVSVPAAFLSGHTTVGEMVSDDLFKRYINNALFGEIIPSIVGCLPCGDQNSIADAESDLKSFADAVSDRFSNPYIKHYLQSILLNSVSKFKARVLPSIIAFSTLNGHPPRILTFSFAALIRYYKGSHLNGGEYTLSDEQAALDFFAEVWNTHQNDTTALVKNVCAARVFWGMDLNDIRGFAEGVCTYLDSIEKDGIRKAMEHLESECPAITGFLTLDKGSEAYV